VDASLLEINPLSALSERIKGEDALLASTPNFRSMTMHYIAIRIFRPCGTWGKKRRWKIEASKFSLNYIKLDGNIACLVNGRRVGDGHHGYHPTFRRATSQTSWMWAGGAQQRASDGGVQIILQDPHVKGSW